VPAIYVLTILGTLLIGIVLQLMSSTENSPLYVALSACDAYAARGYDESYLSAGFTQGSLKQVHSADEPPASGYSIKSMGFDGVDTTTRYFDNRAEEFTLAFDFYYSGTVFNYLRNFHNGLPAVALTGINDNYEVFINGHKIYSAIYLDDEGYITLHKDRHLHTLAFAPDYLIEGANRLTLRVLGDPASSDLGLYYSNSYIDASSIIEKNQKNVVDDIFVGIYIFAGVFFLINSLFQNEKYCLWFGLGLLLMAVYFLMRNTNLDAFFEQSETRTKMQFAALFLSTACIGFYIEYLGAKKLTPVIKTYFAICAALSVMALTGGHALKLLTLNIFMVLLVIVLIYLVIFAVGFRFSRKVRKRVLEGETLTGAVKIVLIDDMLGNIALGILTVFVGVIYEVVNMYVIHSKLSIVPYIVLAFVVGSTVGFSVLSARNRSKSERVSRELEQINTTLETRIAERTAELEEQTQLAIDASQAKSNFLATMSHEIRTPMNAIIGISDIQLGNDTLPEDVAEDLQRIHNSGENLLAIINDILDLSKIETGKLELTPANYDMPSLINDIVQLNIVRIGSKPIEFILKIEETLPANLFGDELRIKQVISNILSNAFKYTDRGSVTLSISQIQSADGVILNFSVADTGQGMKPQDLEKLFSDYTQFNKDANRAVEGTGLGMSITQKLVNMMSGEISVESEFGKGSVFTIKIPQKINGGETIGKDLSERLQKLDFINDRRSRRAAVLRRYMPYGKILVVDDVETNLRVARGLLSPYGLQIDTCLNGADAIALVREAKIKYDIILMDHMMPGMDGIEAVRKIRSEIGSDYAKNVVIVALTANAIVGSAQMFMENGFDDFISKPVDMRQLNSMLNKYIYDKQTAETKAEAERLFAEKQVTKAQKAVVNPLKTEIHIEGVNTATGLNLSDNNLENYIDLLTIFSSDAKKAIATVNSCLENGDIKLYTTTVHSLKSITGTIGAKDISASAAELEKAGHDNDLQFISKHSAAFIETLETVILNIGEYLKTVEKPDSAGLLEVDKTAVKMKLLDLKSAIIARAFKEADAIISGFPGSGYEAEIDEISTQLLTSEFGSALEQTEKLLDALGI
jgi:signal transduction histidine kinase/DNA-binding response OmpR family regulator